MLHSIKNTIKDLRLFLKNPRDNQDVIQTKSQKAKRLFSLLADDIPLMLLISLFLSIFDKLGWVITENHQLNALLELMPLGIVYALAVVIIPFFEELVFRLILRFKSNYLIQIALTVLPESEKGNKAKTWIHEWWNRKFFHLFYLSALAFASLHIFNFDLKTTVIFIFPLLVLPQFILALFAGYLRVRYNFMLGYLMHALHNAVFISLALLSISNSIEKLNVKTQQYSLKIDEVMRVESTLINNGKDSIDFVGITLKKAISLLAKKDENLIDNMDALLNKKISLTYKSNVSDKLNNDSIILQQLGKVYSFTLEPKVRKQKTCMLYVEDSLQLQQHTVQNKSSFSNINILSGNINMENVTFDQLTSELSHAYKFPFSMEDTLTQKLNINLPNGNLSELEHVLKTDYGIHIKETEKEIEHIFVNFKK